jgi:hypothetical protein
MLDVGRFVGVGEDFRFFGLRRITDHCKGL